MRGSKRGSIAGGNPTKNTFLFRMKPKYKNTDGKIIVGFNSTCLKHILCMKNKNRFIVFTFYNVTQNLHLPSLSIKTLFMFFVLTFKGILIKQFYFGDKYVDYRSVKNYEVCIFHCFQTPMNGLNKKSEFSIKCIFSNVKH